MSLLWKTVETFSGEDSLAIMCKMDKYWEDNKAVTKFNLWATMQLMSKVDVGDGRHYRLHIHKAVEVQLQVRRI